MPVEYSNIAADFQHTTRLILWACIFTPWIIAAILIRKALK